MRESCPISRRLMNQEVEKGMLANSTRPTPCSFKYMDLVAEVTASPDVLKACRSEMAPFFATEGHFPDITPFVRITLTQAELEHKPEGAGEVVKVDTSRYAHLMSDGMTWPQDSDRWVTRIDNTGSWFRFNKAQQRIEMFQPDPDKCLIDMPRLLKNLFTTALEEAGYVQLHSSGVLVGDQGVLILGDMWQGKTTLLMELLSRFDTRQLSCDTIVIGRRADGIIEARGWPSPFSVSHGTMADHPELYDRFPAERKSVDYPTLWNENKKTVLTSEDVCAAFGTTIEPACNQIALIILSRFNRNGPIGIEPLSEVEALQDFMRLVYLGSRDPIYHNWHGYFRIEDATIEGNLANVALTLFTGAPVVTMTWAPSAESLMKSVPLLGRQHKSLGRLLVG